ncbi:MAG: VWA domain-containing protein [Planctomycetes bacterium]|nr:VWA domain-containing protein [Planctomycetota bacterium]
MIAFWLLVPPWWPLLLALPAALGLGARLAARSRRRAAAAFGPREAALLGARCSTMARDLLALAAAAAATLALLRPVALGAEQQVAADVVLCLDVSRSMLARDSAPSRFAAAQQQITTLAERAPGARLALLAFGGRAELVAPLCRDGAAITALAEALAPGSHGGVGTRLDVAITLAVEVLQRGQAVGGAIVLLSDGEDFGADATTAARAARAAGVRVHCLAFGSATGSKIVVDDGGGGEKFLREVRGDEVLTRPDRAGLAAVAAAGGGRFAVAVQGDELAGAYARDMVPFATAAAVASGRLSPVPCQGWFLLAAAAFWMLRSMLPERCR